LGGWSQRRASEFRFDTPPRVAPGVSVRGFCRARYGAQDSSHALLYWDGPQDELASLVGNPELSSDAVRERLCTLLQAHRARRPLSRAEIVRERLIEGVRPMRPLLKALTRLP
jgi:hypothetical protein